MRLGKIGKGEWISGISAILLYVVMSFAWFGVEGSSRPNPLLIDLQASRPGKNAWEALDFISIVLLIAIIVALAGVILRIMDSVERLPIRIDVVVAIVGFVSVLLILLRILDPPTFGTEGFIVFEGTVQPPMFLALLSAAGIAFGGCLAVWEEGIFVSDSA